MSNLLVVFVYGGFFITPANQCFQKEDVFASFIAENDLFYLNKLRNSDTSSFLAL